MDGLSITRDLIQIPSICKSGSVWWRHRLFPRGCRDCRRPPPSRKLAMQSYARGTRARLQPGISEDRSVFRSLTNHHFWFLNITGSQRRFEPSMNTMRSIIDHTDSSDGWIYRLFVIWKCECRESRMTDHSMQLSSDNSSSSTSQNNLLLNSEVSKMKIGFLEAPWKFLNKIWNKKCTLAENLKSARNLDNFSWARRKVDLKSDWSFDTGSSTYRYRYGTK